MEFKVQHQYKIWETQVIEADSAEEALEQARRYTINETVTKRALDQLQKNNYVIDDYLLDIYDTEGNHIRI